jgi:hypothetical protein
VATAALKSKKAKELELERLQGTRFQLEMQINTLESASFNAETMAAMKKAATALGDIHGKLYVSMSATVFTPDSYRACFLVLLIRWMRPWQKSRSRRSWRTKCPRRYQAKPTLA